MGSRERLVTAGGGLGVAGRADDQEAARRWRLVLGRYAGDTLSVAPPDQSLDRTLGHLYDREYTARGHRHGTGGDPDGDRGRGRGGGRGGSVVEGLDWLGSARELFPRETFERMQVEAVGRYGMTELLADPQAVEAVEPSTELASALLRVRAGSGRRSGRAATDRRARRRGRGAPPAPPLRDGRRRAPGPVPPLVRAVEPHVRRRRDGPREPRPLGPGARAPARHGPALLGAAASGRCRTTSCCSSTSRGPWRPRCSTAR
nr:hypothetical protein [Cellulosimicrobium sp. MM]